VIYRRAGDQELIIQKSALVFCAVITLSSSLIAAADACACMTSPNSCLGLAKADAVFEATVESVELKTRPGIPVHSSLSSYRSVALRNLISWHGEAATTVVTGSPGNTCAYNFIPGVRYLIVASKDAHGALSVSFCGLTRPLSAATGDLDYLKHLTNPNVSTLVWGTVLMPVRPGRDDGYAPVAKATVSIEGPVSRAVLTGADGRFNVEGLPPGSYTMRASPAQGTRFVGSAGPQPFDLDPKEPRGCAVLIAVLPVETTVFGVVTDESGKPLGGEFMTIVGTNVREGEGGGLGQETRDDGTFMFSGLPPGRYRVKVGGTGSSLGPPYTVVPTTGEMEIELPLGSRIDLPPFRVRRPTQITIRGTAFFPDGTPAPDVALIAVVIPERGRSQPVYPSMKTDASGRFEFAGWEGYRYGIALGSQYPAMVILDFIATGTPVTLNVLPR
jgi:hypothetical protein